MGQTRVAGGTGARGRTPGRPGTWTLLSATLLSVPPRERAAQRSAARIAASMPGNANEKPESSSCPGITR